MILATYENTVVGDRLWFVGNDDLMIHADTVTRKHNKGAAAVVVTCEAMRDSEMVWFPNALPVWAIELRQPSNLETDSFGEYATHIIDESERKNYALTKVATFKQYLGCTECANNYNRAVKGEGYVPHYFSRMCRSGKRPHCTCDSCF